MRKGCESSASDGFGNPGLLPKRLASPYLVTSTYSVGGSQIESNSACLKAEEQNWRSTDWNHLMINGRDKTHLVRTAPEAAPRFLIRGMADARSPDATSVAPEFGLDDPGASMKEPRSVNWFRYITQTLASPSLFLSRHQGALSLFWPT
jgi:hypothetical protein